MKKSDIKKLIQEAIQEILNENTAIISTKTGSKFIPFKDRKELEPLRQDPNVSKIEDTAGNKIKEADLDEAKKFKLIDPNLDTSRFADKRISRVSLQDILDYIKDMNDTGVEVSQLQKQFGFVRPQIANNIMTGLFQSNIVGKVIGGELQKFQQPAATPAGEEPAGEEDGNEEPDVMATEPGYEDTGIVDKDLSDEEIEASFAKAKAADEEEPEADFGTGGAAGAQMSDEDYEAFMKYTELESRLNKVKSDIQKIKRSKGSTPGDIKDKPSNELKNLLDLKMRLQDKMNDVLATSDYLKARQAKINKAEEPEIKEPEELDEWIKGRWQYYAGIKD